MERHGKHRKGPAVVAIIAMAAFLTACPHKTNKGVTVSGNSVSQSAEDAIQRGISVSIDNARCKGWFGGLTLEDYSVVITDGIDHDGIVVREIPCGSYCGTEYDHGGKIYVGGQFDEPTRQLVLPYMPGRDSDLQLAAQYESEHQLLLLNSLAEYQRTKIHAPGQGHPLLSCTSTKFQQSAPSKTPSSNAKKTH